MIRIEHIGIAVKNLESANKLYKNLLGEAHYKIESVESELVNTSFFKTDNSKIELLESTSSESAINLFIEKRGEGLHHIAFEVEDIHAEMKRLKEAGFKLTRDEPFRGADNKLVCFVHPKTVNGVLIELCQEIK